MNPTGLDWYNQNALRAYPLREGTTQTTSSGGIVLPQTFLVGARLALSSDVNQRAYVKTVTLAGSVVTLQLADQSDVTIGTCTWTDSPTGFKSGTSAFLQGTGIYSRAQGRLIAGSLADLRKLPSGTYTFTIGATELETSVLVPAQTGVSAITFTATDGTSLTKTGNVQWVARTNLQFKSGSASSIVYLDAGDGLGLNNACLSRTCVQSINGVTPDTDGNIQILGSDCLNITSAVGELVFSDTCCTPCAGCDNLATLTERLSSLETFSLDLKGTLNNLNNQITSYLAVSNSSCSCD